MRIDSLATRVYSSDFSRIKFMTDVLGAVCPNS